MKRTALHLKFMDYRHPTMWKWFGQGNLLHAPSHAPDVIRQLGDQADLVKALVRAGNVLLDHGAVIEKVESLGFRDLPYKRIAKQTREPVYASNFFLFHAHMSTEARNATKSILLHDLDMVHVAVVPVPTAQPPIKCNLEEILKPPSERQDFVASLSRVPAIMVSDYVRSPTGEATGDRISEDRLFQALYDMEVFRLGEYYLKSGQMTPIYIDLRRTFSQPKTLRMAAQAICDLVAAKGLSFEYVVGVPYAALPLATLVSDILDVPMLMKRKEVKSYGTGKLIEGVYQVGGTALIVEDVVTSGESIRETAESLRKEGLKVTDAVAVLDRQQGGTKELSKSAINFHSVLTMEKILDGLISKNQITEQRKKEIIDHLNKPF
ncbi:orotate phosphoribosyltransferase [Oesophagostomum dentatum]|uniref:Uridine 5'-monophosphate synthase n=1 Tax=Oesophagostomum dentatum TaxID=61180 RepID=A0A0B1SZ73_OESDE|nr:orotate phosphoribosyltransferase [Oesophagostomum dentatum]